jgi:uncharacterized protein (DUF697 family)
MGLKRAVLGFAGARAMEPLIGEVAERLTVATERAIEEIVERRGVSVAADADVFRLKHPELRGRDLEGALIADRRWRCAAMGAVSALPGVVPGAGTTIEVVAAVADALNITYQQVELVLAIAYLRGRDVTDENGRKLDVLLVLGLEAGVIAREKERLVAEDLDLTLEELRTNGVPAEVVARLNRTVGGRVVRRVARRRARVAVGRLIPAGIGVVIAAAADYLAVRSAGNAALEYFEWIENVEHKRPSLTAA